MKRKCPFFWKMRWPVLLFHEKLVMGLQYYGRYGSRIRGEIIGMLKM